MKLNRRMVRVLSGTIFVLHLQRTDVNMADYKPATLRDRICSFGKTLSFTVSTTEESWTRVTLFVFASHQT